MMKYDDFVKTLSDISNIYELKIEYSYLLDVQTFDF